MPAVDVDQPSVRVVNARRSVPAGHDRAACLDQAPTGGPEVVLLHGAQEPERGAVAEEDQHDLQVGHGDRGVANDRERTAEPGALVREDLDFLPVPRSGVERPEVLDDFAVLQHAAVHIDLVLNRELSTSNDTSVHCQEISSLFYQTLTKGLVTRLVHHNH